MDNNAPAPGVSPPDTAFQPLILDGPAGRLLAIYHPPAPGKPLRGSLVYVPPFGEEMNQSRRMAALQARALAASGVGVLTVDLYGTGDSAGDFAEARWDVWLGDIAAALDWLQTHAPGPHGLLGLRLGGLLAMAAVRQRPGLSKAILWQPVTKGSTVLVQFLRLRLAAAMGSGQPEETTKEMLAALKRGESLEVAGYELPADLALAMEAARLQDLTPQADLAVRWLEVVPRPDAAGSPASLKVIEAWRQAGANASLTSVVGEPFWSIQETTLVPALWQATLDAWSDA